MDTLQLLDGSIEIISSTKEFSELIQRKLGTDARLWFDDLAADYQTALTCIDNLYDQVEKTRQGSFN